MASAYGIIHQYGEPQSTFDANLALQALSHKQEGFDANLLKIEQTLNQWGLRATQIKNTEAREYLFQKIDNLTSNINNLSGADLSEKGVTQGIIGHVNQALDPTVMYHLAAGKQIEQFQANIQQIRDDNPEKLSNLNLQDAMQRSGYNEYVNGGLDAKLGALSYTPYVDTEMVMNERIEKIKKTFPKQTVEIVLPDGRTETTTVENMTDAQWAQYLPNLITPEIQAQFEVEGRAKLGWSDQMARDNAKEIRNTTVDSKKQRLASLNTDLQGQISEGERAAITREKQLLEQQIATLETTTFENITATNMGGMAVRNNFINRTAARIGSKPSVSLEGKPTDSTNRVKAGLLGGPGVPSALITTPLTQENQEIITQEGFAEREVAADKVFDNSITTAYTTLTPEIKTLVDTKVNEIMTPGNPNYDPNRTVEDARYEAMLLNVPMNSTDSYAKVDAMKKAKAVSDNYYKAREETSKEVTEETWAESADGIYQALFNEGHNITLTGDNGTAVTTADYFDSKGIRTKEDFKEFINSPASQDFKAQYNVEMVLNTGVNSQFDSLGSQLNEGDNSLVQLAPDFYKSFNRLSTTLNENVDVTDIFTIRDEEGNELDESQIMAAIKKGTTDAFNIQLNNEGKTESSTFKYLKNGIVNGRYTPAKDIKNIFRRDMSFYEDDYMRNIFSNNNYDKKYNSKLLDKSINIAGLSAITYTDVPSTNKEAAENPNWDRLQAFASNPNNTQRTQFDFAQPIVFRRGPGNTIIATQFEGDTKTDWDTETIFSAGGDKVAVGSMSDFARLVPDLYRNIIQKETEGELVLGIGETKYSKVRSFPETTIQSKKAALNYLGPNMAALSIRDEAVQTIKNQLPSIFQSSAAQGYNTLLNRAFDNTHKFRTGYVENQDGSKYVSLEGNVGTPEAPEWKLISEIDVSKNTAETVQRTLNTANQAYLTIGLANILREVESRETTEDFGRFNNLKATLKIR